MSPLSPCEKESLAPSATDSDAPRPAERRDLPPPRIPSWRAAISSARFDLAQSPAASSQPDSARVGGVTRAADPNAPPRPEPRIALNFIAFI